MLRKTQNFVVSKFNHKIHKTQKLLQLANKMTTVLSCALFVVLSCFHVKGEDYELTVLHTNDVHAHIEQFNTYGGTCEPEQAQKQKCFGGVARRHTVIESMRASTPNTILIDGGDQFSGTLWFTIYKGLAAVVFMNYTRYDAMAIGNHEFDNGPENLVEFMKQADFPIVCTNMNVSQEPVWPDPPIYTSSTILERGGKKIGVIGYTTPDISWLSKPGKKITFSDPVESIRKEAKRLKAQGINILIALGHAGFDIDQKIGREVEELDLVVGGHTNTFLWNGPQPSVEKIEGPYPFIVKRADGTECPVVQDFTYGKYLGNLKLVFDSSTGKLKSWSGNPIMLNGSYTEDPEALQRVKEMSGPILAARNDPLAKTLVFLEGDRSLCRLNECNLGNFLVDAMVRETQQPITNAWANVALGLWNSGGIRSGNIDKKPDDYITREELSTISPFGNTADIIEIKGKFLKEAFHYGFSGLEANEGRFLQVSGFKVKYDKSKPKSSRMVEVKALCTQCRVPVYEPLEDEKVYTVVTSDYLAWGGDGFSSLQKYEKVTKGMGALELLEKHFKRMSPVRIGNEERVVDISGATASCPTSSASYFCASLFLAIFGPILQLIL